jgi:hypothetical protein
MGPQLRCLMHGMLLQQRSLLLLLLLPLQALGVLACLLPQRAAVQALRMRCVVHQQMQYLLCQRRVICVLCAAWGCGV